MENTKKKGERTKNYNRQLAYARHKPIHPAKKNSQQIKEQTNKLMSSKSDQKLPTTDMVNKIMKDVSHRSTRYFQALYSPSPIVNPQPPSSPKNEQKLVNLSRYRKMMYDYEGFLNKEGKKQQKTMKKMKSAANIYLEKDWFGKIEEKPSSKRVNVNRTASTIQFG